MDDLDLGATIKGFIPGQKLFKRYTLIRILGRGGMGVVWLARDEELGRDTALKFLPEVVAGDPAAVDDLKREVRRAIDLAHPHIVKIHDFVTDGRIAAVSMEYVEGDTLSALRVSEPSRVFAAERLSPWVAHLCSALAYAHGKAKVAHRDLKPANLMIDREGDLKVLDFGIAASMSDSVSRVSAQAGSSGTPVYMSPQQMMGEKAAVTDDIYALGATLYELLTGKPPFHSGNIMLQVQNKVPPPMAERREELGITGGPIPPAWEQTIAACLAKAAADRPPSAAAVARQLGLAVDASLAELAPDSPAGRKPAPPATRSEARPSKMPLLAGLAAVLALGGGGYYFGIHAPGRQREAEAQRQAVVQRLQEEERLRGEREAADAAAAREKADQAERERLDRLAAGLRSQLAELNVGFDAILRVQQTAERDLADLKSRERDLARDARGGSSPELRAASAQVRAQENFVRWLEDNLPAHPARIAKAKAEDLLAARAWEEAVAAIEAYRAALPQLQADLAQSRRELLTITGGLRVTSEPAGIDFTLEDVYGRTSRGKTPVELSEVPLGRTTITYQRLGWPDQVRTVTVGRGELAGTTVDMVGGGVEVTSTPAGLNFVLEGQGRTERGRTPARLAELPPGDYAVTMQRDGWPGQTQPVSIKRGQQVKAQVEYPAGGTLKVTSTPSGAEVWLKDRQLGTTPLSLGDFPPGQLDLELRLKHHHPGKATGALSSAGQLELSAALTRNVPEMIADFVRQNAGTWAWSEKSWIISMESKFVLRSGITTLRNRFTVDKSVTYDDWEIIDFDAAKSAIVVRSARTKDNYTIAAIGSQLTLTGKNGFGKIVTNTYNRSADESW